jgi:type II secretory pathway pseudopilin PulG
MIRMLKVKAGKKNERGFSLLEAMFASMIMIIGIGGLMALFVVAAAKNAGQGNQATRCTEYAQDKMEQLLALPYADSTSSVVGANTTPNAGPVGTIGLTPGGNTDGNPLTAVVNYVDYVNISDTSHPDGISGSAAGAQYMREWKIEADPYSVKSITVYVQAQFTADVNGLSPRTTLVGMKQPN